MMNKKIIVIFIFVFPIFLSAQEFAFLNKKNTSVYSKNFSYPKKTNEQKPPLSADYNYVLSTNPLRAIANFLVLGIDMKLTDRNAIKVVAGYCEATDGSSLSFTDNNKNLSGARFELMYKCFLGRKPKVFQGYYFAPYGFYKFMNFDYTYTSFNNPFGGSGTTSTYSLTAKSYSYGIVLGYQFPIINENFSIDIFMGEGITRCSGSNTTRISSQPAYKLIDRVADRYESAIGIYTGLSIGFGF